MRKEEIFFDAITNIREELVEVAQEYRFRRRSWTRYAGLAACLVLAATLCFGAYGLSQIRLGSMASKDSDDNCNGAQQAPTASEPGGSPTGDAGGSPTGDAGGGGEDGENQVVEEPEGLLYLTGPVLEVGEDCLLIDWEGPVEVPFTGLEELPVIREGDVVTAACAEIVQEEDRTVASGVEKIWLVEP